jgi:hypothetical protein
MVEEKTIESNQLFSSSNRRFYFSVENQGVAESKAALVCQTGCMCLSKLSMSVERRRNNFSARFFYLISVNQPKRRTTTR